MLNSNDLFFHTHEIEIVEDDVEGKVESESTASIQNKTQ